MNLTELQEHYAKVYKMIAKERRRRVAESVLVNSTLLKQDIAECDQALACATAMKDELKRLIASAVQETLFDLPEGLQSKVE